MNNTLCILFSYKNLTCHVPETYLNICGTLCLYLSFATYYIIIWFAIFLVKKKHILMFLALCT